MANDPTSELNTDTGCTEVESSNQSSSPVFESDKVQEDSKIPQISIDMAVAEQKNNANADGVEKAVNLAAEKGNSPETKLSFKVHQDVVYPLQGVGKIIEQVQRKFKGEFVDYYTVYIDATDMTVMLPIGKAQELGLRPIVPKADAEQALKSMSDKNEPLTSDWKLRYQNNLDLLKEGGVMDIATVVRSLYHRSKVKELPILERKLYDNALKLMVDEISLALGREKEKVEDLLHTRLENSNN